MSAILFTAAIAASATLIQEQAFADVQYPVNRTINPGEEYVVNPGTTVIIRDTEFTIADQGVVIIKGHFLIEEGGTISNHGTISILKGQDVVTDGEVPGQISNYGIINNDNRINNANFIYNYNIINNGHETVTEGPLGPPPANILNQYGGTFINYHTINNFGTFTNQEYLANHHIINNNNIIRNHSVISNNHIIYNDKTITNYDKIYNYYIIQNACKVSIGGGGEILINPPLLCPKESPLGIVPDWVKKIAYWWAGGQVPEDEFLGAMKWLLENKIINIAENDIPILEKVQPFDDDKPSLERIQP